MHTHIHLLVYEVLYVRLNYRNIQGVAERPKKKNYAN